MKCPKCAEEAGSGRFCRNCGTSVAAAAVPVQAGSVCPVCGAEVRPGARFCGSCAAPLGSAPAAAPAAASSVICVNCGTENKADTKFCRSCGKAVGSGAPAVVPSAGVTPDMLPTMMDARPVPVPQPPSPRPAAVVGQARPVAAPAPTPPRVAPVAAPRLVQKGAPAGDAAGTPSRPSAGNPTVIVATVIVLALAVAGLVYKFVLKKPATQSAQNAPAADTPASAQVTPPATPPATTTDSSNPDTQAQPASTDTQPAAADTTTTTTPAGNSPASSGGPAAPPKAPKRTPAKALGPSYAQAHANAEQAFSASQYITPPDGSALFWARKAKALGDPAAGEIEQRVFAKQMSDVTAARQSHLYDQALAQLYQAASNFPEHTELRSMQDDIHQEQQRYNQQMEEQRRQAELAAQTKKFPAQHRHGTGENFCTGVITITPDGVGHYDCNTADSKGRCEHVTFAADSLKEVKVRGDGSLHVATRQQGNFDFTGGEFALKDAATALGKLVKH